MAIPSQERWHKKPTALMGGIAIFSAMALPLAFRADYASLIPHLLGKAPSGHLPSLTAVTLLGATILFGLGVVDDFINIKPHSKLLGQILTASLVTFLGFRLQWVTSLTLDTMLTIAWIVGITNAFNLLDNMDGLCAGVGLVGTLFLAYLFLPLDPAGSQVGLALAGALIAFLVFNFNPASIFMGDCGSLPIGFTLSMLSLAYAGRAMDTGLAAYAVPIMVMLVPLLDTSMVTLIRTLSGRKAMLGGKDHTSHRLVLMGFSEKQAVLFLYGIGAVAGIAAVFVTRTDSLTSPSVIIPLAVAVLLMALYLAQIHVYPEKEFSVLKGRTFTPVLLELTYKRQISLVILDFGLVAFAYYLSYRLRFDAREFPIFFQIFLRSLPAVIACKLTAYFTIGVYRGIWGYMSSNDVQVYLKASTLGTLLSVVAVTFVYRFEAFSKGIFLIDWLLATGLLLGSRGFYRLAGDFMKRKSLNGERVLIYGAGRGGEILLREVLNNPSLKISPLGFIDDDPLKNGKKLQGYPVLGAFADLEQIHQRQPISVLLISFNHQEEKALDEIKAFCRRHAIQLKQFSVCIDPVDTEPAGTRISS
jgi:UDP-GlcNAc:undecaprenyl-phosphate GlcNAc-1-phosphate transferase